MTTYVNASSGIGGSGSQAAFVEDLREATLKNHVSGQADRHGDVD